MIHSKIYLFPLVALSITTITGIIASASTTSAEDITPVDDEVTITVDSACTMGQTTLGTNPTLNPGETGAIGSSRISAYCNDASGYDIYAIGYTNGEYGNTNMINTTGNTIPTGLSGEGSYWDMQLTSGTSTTTPSYTPTITNNFTSPSTIPNDYTKVATYPSTTISQSEDPLSSGSYFTTTYTSHISTTQPAGVYTGQVQYVMVHPQGAEPPKTINDIINAQDFVTLTPSQKKLVKNSMKTGIQYQIKDSRDDKYYYISKLADGNIWMTQNLDLDLDSAKIYTPEDTDITENWTPSISTYATNDYTWDRGSRQPISYDPGNRYWNGEIYSSYYGTLETATAQSGDPHYHIGNYYSWTAAVATNTPGIYTEGGADQSICPAGWRLPVYSGDKSFGNVIQLQGLTSGLEGNIQSFPSYYTYGGYWFGASAGVGGTGYYWSDAVAIMSNSYGLYFNFLSELDPQHPSARAWGYSVRCVAR